MAEDQDPPEQPDAGGDDDDRSERGDGSSRAAGHETDPSSRPGPIPTPPRRQLLGPRSPLIGQRTTPELERVPSWMATAAAWTWRILVLIVGFVAVFYVLSTLALVTIPVIIAIILATLLVPPARALERRGFPRAAAASIVVLGSIAAVGGLIAAITPSFVAQVQELQPTVVEAIDQLFVFLEESPLDYDREEVMDLLASAAEQLQEQGGQVAGQVASGVVAVGQFLAGLALAIVLVFFFVKDGEPITDWLIARTPNGYQDVTRAVGRRAWTALSGFVRGTAAIALIDAVGIGIGLVIVGVPLVLPLMLLVFIGGFIPVLGAFLSGLIAVLVALASGGFVQAAIVLGIVVLVQQVESNVLQPTIMRRAVALHPVVVLGALTAGGVLGGILGAFLAVPIAAVASAVSNELRLRHDAAEGGLLEEDQGPEPLGPVDDDGDGETVPAEEL